MSLSFGQVGLMTAKIAGAADGARHAPGDCHGCDDGDHKDVDDYEPDNVRLVCAVANSAVNV